MQNTPKTPKFNPITGAIRAPAMDAVQKANSGHPGMPMGMAEIAEVVWRHNLRHNPANPKWANRDRFVISNGHGSMLHYALLHLTGYDLPIDELKNFRQLGSKTPGHPEVHHTPGIETTTGPLGQGFANAVGFALAEKLLAAQFNRPGHDIVDHNTYVFLGDGCLMEGISHEVASLAGTWQLGGLVACYDDNGISIDGEVKGWFTDDTVKRFESYGWQVIGPIDGHDSAVLLLATLAKPRPTRPSARQLDRLLQDSDRPRAAPTLEDFRYCRFAAWKCATGRGRDHRRRSRYAADHSAGPTRRLKSPPTFMLNGMPRQQAPQPRLSGIPALLHTEDSGSQKARSQEFSRRMAGELRLGEGFQPPPML